ncbi:serine/threonine-protein kinase [Cryptosporangium phraense]|uniref:non-specific serine/threonine protein kinase n=1 Tax=Cryptosporangium phraense TaxID=2593070 RepID=A0A545AKG4_9ACTN|nr:serine/threonine-protein kinase [Cryptosporangium phraense]TQS41789.1 serine/threonine protein kinase [Cryptosporangium phraense]
MAEQRAVDGRYRLDAVVGSGGMGVVWRAYDLRLNRTVAVKEVRFPSTINADERETLTKRALLEAQSAGRLDHPNIVPVHDVILHDEQPFIIMRFVDGRSLDRVVAADGPLTPREVARIGVELLDALSAAHASNVIHRDVKPHNVLIQRDGTAQLTDFSIASVFGTETLTKTGALLGSPGYIAPERLMKGETTPAGDLFALGATLFFAVEGISPFTAKETIVGLFASATQPHPRPKRAGARLTPIIDGLLEKTPENRLEHARARAMLKSIADNESEESATRSGEFVPPPPGRVDTDERANVQGDEPSNFSTAVFAVLRPAEQLRPLSWQSGPGAEPLPSEPLPYTGEFRRDSGDFPVSGGAVHGRPISGVPVSGAAPVSGGAVYGRPVSGAPISGGAVYGRPVSGAPPVSGPRYDSYHAAPPVSGARELAWGPGNVGGGPPPTDPPSFTPDSPPPGNRGKRVLAVVAILILALAAGAIANMVATSGRTDRATRASTIEDPGQSNPAPIPTPTTPVPSPTEAQPSPSQSTLSPSPTTPSPDPDPDPDVPPSATVVSASLASSTPLQPKDCTAPLTVNVRFTISVSAATRVVYKVTASSGESDLGVNTTTAADTFSPNMAITIANPATGTISISGLITTPGTFRPTPVDVQVICPSPQVNDPPSTPAA